jgi:apolipoprotein N-acyltransferase
LICYELYFGNQIAKYTQKGDVELIAVTSNDYYIREPIFVQQLIRMARTQAISFRKSIVKSTNQGISLIISPKGEIVATSNFNTSEVISAKVSISNELTPYGKYGNVVAALLCLALLLPMKILDYYEKKSSSFYGHA